jgi:hypothetical protein
MAKAMARIGRWLVGDGWTFEPWTAVARVPAIALSIGLGAALGSPLRGVLAASGALLVGFGASFELRHSREHLLLVTTAGIGAAAAVGSMAGAHLATALVLAGAVGWACGDAAEHGASAAWIALRCGVAAVIATSYPASLAGAASRAAVVIAGGLAQVGLLALANVLRPLAHASVPAASFDRRHTVRVAAALAIAMLAERLLGLRNGYWAPVTALLVLRPDREATITRGVSRVVGTLVGVGLASLVVLALSPSALALGVLASMMACGAYVFQGAGYGLLSLFVTMYVVFALSFAGQPEQEVALARVVATALGGGIALVVELVGPS